jgi:hypothetical protein
MAVSFFNDSYDLFTPLNFSDVGIALSADRRDRFAPLSPLYTDGVRHLRRHTAFPGETTNEHFIVWMHAAAFASFRKLYSRCDDCAIPSGNFSIAVASRYPADTGERWLVLAATGRLGSRSLVLPLASLALAGLAIAAALLSFLVTVVAPPRAPLQDLDLELLA